MKSINLQTIVAKALFVVAALLTCGCATYVSHFTVISTRNVHFDLSPEDFRGRFEGNDLRWWVWGIPIEGFSHVKDAADEALELGQGNIMLNVVIHEKVYGLWPLLGMHGFTVTGDVYDIE